MAGRDTRNMWPPVRVLRGRGLVEDGLLARPERPRRCTLPMTALRVIPPSSAAIWLADRPSAHNLVRSSTRLSVQPDRSAVLSIKRLSWSAGAPESLRGILPHSSAADGHPNAYAYWLSEKSAVPD